MNIMNTLYKIKLLFMAAMFIGSTALGQMVRIDHTGSNELIPGDSLLLCAQIDPCCTGPYQYEWKIGDSLVVGTDSCLYAKSLGIYCLSVTCATGCKGRNCQSIEISTSIPPEASPASLNDISLHPNPASNILHISGVAKDQHPRYYIVDPWGRQVIRSESPDIDVHRLAAGLYFVRVELKAGIEVLRFVKE